MFLFSLDNVLAQMFQPYFYYSVIFLIFSFICIKILLKYDRLLSRRTRSITYILPLIIPLLVMGFFRPGTSMRTVDGSGTMGTLILSLNGNFAGASPGPSAFNPAQNAPFGTSLPPISLELLPAQVEVLSITGIICLVGLAVAASYLTLAMALDDKIVSRLFHVIPLGRDEYSSLQSEIVELSRKLGVKPPRIGLIEDLRPNAFIAGYGRKTMLVFSVGILNVLSEEELAAVGAHELSHVKDHDFLFKTFSYALAIVSFFNPFSYFAASAAQREREMLADEKGSALLRKPGVLAAALEKTCKALQEFPKQGFGTRLASGLFLVSPIARRPEILATHPRVNQRIDNIARLALKSRAAGRNKAITVALSFLIILGGLAVSYPMVRVQTAFSQNQSRLVSLRIPVEGVKFGLVSCLEGIEVRPDEPAPAVEFAVPRAPTFVDAIAKQPRVSVPVCTNMAFEPHVFSMSKSSYFYVLVVGLTEKTNSMVELAREEQATSENIIVLVFCLPSVNLETQQACFYTVFASSDGTSNYLGYVSITCLRSDTRV
jgi:heat shock protein HtpX